MTPKASGARAPAAIVLAAGEGTRFRSATPKVLHDLCGRPLVMPVLDAIALLKPTRTVVVTGRAADDVEAAIGAQTKRALTFARQAEQRGTADAARVGEEALGTHAGPVLVVPGDTPLLTPATLRALVARHRRTDAAATVLIAEVADPTGYGRVARHPSGVVSRIVEERDASATERALHEVNAGVYVFERSSLAAALASVTDDNAQGELYLPDVIGILADKGERIDAATADPTEIMGVNDRAQMAAAAAVLRARINERLMRSGVTIVDPAQTYIEAGVKVKPDTVIHPMTFLTGATTIGAGCEIGPGTRIADSKVGDRARVISSEVDQAVIGPEASVGPYAYLRPGARLGRRSKVGTFVEVKNSIVGEGSKVPHLSYIGDAVIGKDVNIGAATVTVNYDAETKIKSQTSIGDGAKIGSDTMLVAPVKVGKNAVTGAGSVVTNDVPPGTVVVGVPARKLRKRKPKGDRA